MSGEPEGLHSLCGAGCLRTPSLPCAVMSSCAERCTPPCSSWHTTPCGMYVPLTVCHTYGLLPGTFPNPPSSSAGEAIQWRWRGPDTSAGRCRRAHSNAGWRRKVVPPCALLPYRVAVFVPPGRAGPSVDSQRCCGCGWHGCVCMCLGYRMATATLPASAPVATRRLPAASGASGGDGGAAE